MSILYKLQTHKKAKQNKNLYTGLKLYLDKGCNHSLITYCILSTQNTQLFSKLIITFLVRMYQELFTFDFLMLYLKRLFEKINNL